MTTFSAPPPASGPDEAGAWTLQLMDGKPAPEDTQNKPLYVEFDAEKKEIRGFAGVNRFNGNYHLEGRQLIIKRMATTRMVGPLSKQERRFLDILQEGPEVFIEGKTLKLVDGQTLAEFKKAPQIDIQPVDP